MRPLYLELTRGQLKASEDPSVKVETKVETYGTKTTLRSMVSYFRDHGD